MAKDVSSGLYAWNLDVWHEGLIATQPGSFGLLADEE